MKKNSSPTIAKTVARQPVETPIKRAFLDNDILVVGCLFLAFLPIARICYVIATTGADCINNDDIIFVGLTESIFSGSYNWLNYFENTFINGHCSAAAQAMFLLLSPITSWNQYTLCFFGVAMCALRTHLTARFLAGATDPKLYLPIVAIVSWMFFSFSQISIFTTGIFCVMWQACLLLMTAGAYLLWCHPERISAVVASSVLGILACWNLAIALPCWLPYFLIAALRSAHKKVAVTVLAVGAAIAATPYLLFVASGATQSRDFATQFVHWFDHSIFVNALGRCFSDHIGCRFEALPHSELAGVVGLSACTMLAALLVASRPLRKALAPCFILCAWSIATLLMIGIVRPNIAPWYALIAAGFWSGLATASVIVIADRLKSSEGKREVTVSAALSCLILLAVAYWTWSFNGTYFDKQYYLENRTPVSASVLRNYDIAPASFAPYVFKLPGLSVAVTAEMLKRNHWSLFSRKQAWTMQGDSVFPLTEGFTRGVSLAGAAWVYGRDKTATADFKSFQHLNLCVSGSAAASWRVSLPTRANSIVLKTAVASAGSSSRNWSVMLRSERLHAMPARYSGRAKSDWQPVRIDLTEYQGEDLNIQLHGSPDGAVVFEYPVIEVIER